MRELVELIGRVAAVDATVLVRGESGTGKEVAARAIHSRSARRSGPFVALNCAAIPKNLVEAELFGHVKGAFTDAHAARDGLFEQARGGTLFLDEIAELDLSLQPKLLRAIQERAIRPIGSDEEVEIDVRLLTATNADLASAVAKGDFRADLFYRLNVIDIVVPPLRERDDDVLVLARHFLGKYARAMNRPVQGLTSACAAKLRAHAWPGNVRELANVMERAVALTRSSHLTVDDLPAHVRERHAHLSAKGTEPLLSLAELERSHIRRVMKATGGNKSLAAQILGVDRRTLYRKRWAENEVLARPARAAATEIAAPLRERFIENRRRDVGTVRAALEHGDFEVVSRIGHNMRGNGTSYGFPVLSAIGARMEAAAEANDRAGAYDALVQLEYWLLHSPTARADGGEAESARHPASSTRMRATPTNPDGASRSSKGRG
jgi:DNA-binding protein Fis